MEHLRILGVSIIFVQSIVWIFDIWNMDFMELESLLKSDLNLLVAFQALAEEGSVSRAARRLGRSQPATSAALARLRELLQDPVLIRKGRRMELTPRAETLRAPIAALLRGASEVLGPAPDFVPAETSRELRLLLTDFSAEILLGPLLAKVCSEAPNMRLRVHTSYPERPEELEHGDLDLWVIGSDRRVAGLPYRKVQEDSWAVVGSSRFHKPGNRPMTKKRMSELQFVIGDEKLEASLGRSGIDSREFRRRVKTTLVYDRWDVAMLRDTPLVRAVPATWARELSLEGSLICLGSLTGGPTHRLFAQWTHPKSDDPGVEWLVERIIELLNP